MRIKGIHAFIGSLLVVTAFFLLIKFFPADADESIKINNYYAEISISDSGDMTVHEEWDMNYLGDYRVRFRDIEYNKFPSNYPFPHDDKNKSDFDKTNYSMEFYKDDINYTDDVRFGYSFLGDYDEQYERVACPTDSATECESFFMDTKKASGLKGNVRLVYNYTITNVITEYSDISELNWTLFEYAENTVQNGQVKITLPNNFDEYYLYNSKLQLSATEKTENSITFSFSNKTNKQSLAFRLLVPTTTFTDIGDNQTFIHPDMNKESILSYEEDLIDNNNYYANSDYILFAFSVLSSFMLGVIIVYFVRKIYLQTPQIDKATNVVSPPSDHSPAVVGYFYKGGIVLPEHISATLLDLINRGYLEVDDSDIFEGDTFSMDDVINNEKEKVVVREDPLTQFHTPSSAITSSTSNDIDDRFNITLRLNEDKDFNNLKQYEKVVIKTYINKIGDGSKVSLKDIKECSSKASEASRFTLLELDFESALLDDLSQYNYYDKSIENKKSKLYFFSIIPLLIGIVLLYIYNQYHVYNIIAVAPIILSSVYIYSTIFSTRIRSEWGEKFYQDWNSYKENLENLHILSTSNITDVEFWDQNLVYATTFDIAEKVLNDLEYSTWFDQDTMVQTNYSSRSHNIYYSYYLRRNLSTLHSRSHYQASSTIHAATARTSGSSFGGGSFGGGGGGGRSR